MRGKIARAGAWRLKPQATSGSIAAVPRHTSKVTYQRFLCYTTINIRHPPFRLLWEKGSKGDEGKTGIGTREETR
jgi:hypothetical protein